MTAISVDPRLRDRRAAVAREAGRRRLRRLVIGAAIVGLLVGAYGLVRSPLLDVDDVTYSGLDQTSLDAAVAAAGIDTGHALLDVDAAAIERRLEALPWVDTATVDRSWTGRVTIEVTERVAVAAVMREQNAWVLVDASGRVLTGIVAVAPDIPKISGVSAAGEPGTRLFADADAPLQVAAMLPPSLEGEVDGIYLDELGELWVSLKTADRVIFGDHRDLALKVVAMTEVLADLREKGRVAFEIDVSVPTLSVVRDLRASLRPAQTAAAVEGSAPAGAASPGA